MSLTERTVIDQLEVLRDGTVQVREATEVLRDGEVIATQYHRYVIPASDESPDVSRLDAQALAVVQAARTPERIAAAKARVAATDAALADATTRER